jgi:hypothetical protein
VVLALDFASYLISLGCHDDVVAVQSTYLVCPPSNRYAAPLRQDGGMMSLSLGELTDSIRKHESSGKISHLILSLQLLHSIPLDHLPVRNLISHIVKLLGGKGRRAGLARLAMLLH